MPAFILAMSMSDRSIKDGKTTAIANVSGVLSQANVQARAVGREKNTVPAASSLDD